MRIIFRWTFAGALIATYLLMFACNKGEWVTQTTYRPKRPSFSILRKPFQGNSSIDTNYLYISTKKMIAHDGTIEHYYRGFYADGRMIADGYSEHEAEVVLERDNSFETAAGIGHYTTKGNLISIQIFSSGDGGIYRTFEGIIRRDSIIMVDTVPMLFRRDIRYDTLVLSRFLLK
jgi:hypothetical protein